MSISQIINIYHKNRIENIKKMKNGIEKDLAIGSLISDLGGKGFKVVALFIGSC